jgi:hypothetical protein
MQKGQFGQPGSAKTRHHTFSQINDIPVLTIYGIASSNSARGLLASAEHLRLIFEGLFLDFRGNAEIPEVVAARIRAALEHLPPERLIPAPIAG